MQFQFERMQCAISVCCQDFRAADADDSDSESVMESVSDTESDSAAESVSASLSLLSLQRGLRTQLARLDFSEDLLAERIKGHGHLFLLSIAPHRHGVVRSFPLSYH